MRILTPKLARMLDKKKMGYVELTSSGCYYAPNAELIRRGQKDSSCKPEYNLARLNALKAMKPSVVVIAGRLAVWITGHFFDNEEGGRDQDERIFLQPVNFQGDEVSRKIQMGQIIKQNISDLLVLGHRVVLIYPVPEVGWKMPDTVAKLLVYHSDEISNWLSSGGLTTGHEMFKKRQKEVYDIYDSLGEHPNLLRIYPEKIFCNSVVPGCCITHNANLIFYSDSDHVSKSGATLIVREVEKQIKIHWDM